MSRVKLLFLSVLVCLGFLVFAQTSFAKTKVSYPKATPTPTATPVANVDSFALFWPLAPGKVMGDSLYSLKTLKEKIQGFFIFNAPQKADYEMFLATKRAVEAEKLLGENKLDLAGKTLDEFLNKVNFSSSKWDEAKSKGNVPGETKTHMGQQLENLSIFLKYLSSKNQGDIKSKLDQGLAKIREFQNSL